MKHPAKRKSGELAFAAFLTIASIGLLVSAYSISKFEALSAPGAIPMATTLVMVITASLVFYQTSRATPDTQGKFFVDIMPPRIAIIAALLIAYAIALKPLGFLPTSAAFLLVTIKYLSRRSWFFATIVGLACLLGIYLVFRIVFTVLMPAGIVPEGEILAWMRHIFAGEK